MLLRRTERYHWAQAKREFQREGKCQSDRREIRREKTGSQWAGSGHQGTFEVAAASGWEGRKQSRHMLFSKKLLQRNGAWQGRLFNGRSYF